MRTRALSESQDEKGIIISSDIMVRRIYELHRNDEATMKFLATIQ